MADRTDGIHFSIDLRTHELEKVVRLSNIEKAADGSGYSCQLAVVCGKFSCSRLFSFNDELLRNAVSNLREMSAGRVGTARICGRWERDYIELRSNDMGHVFVSGEINEFTEFTQHLKFQFRTDQTVLAPLLNDLQALLDAPPTE